MIPKWLAYPQQAKGASARSRPQHIPLYRKHPNDNTSSTLPNVSEYIMQKHSAVAVALTAALLAGQPVAADPAGGVSVSYIFGEGFAVGVKVFSNDEEEEVVGYLGLDYVFNSAAVRPNAGIAYLFEDAFIGGDVGWDIGAGVANFGLSGGWADTTDPTEATSTTATDGGTGGDGDGGGDGDIEIIPCLDCEV
ncbi:hypothetical protein ACRDNQ_11110 [Palleronia sp. KMU-117]|uniref:hypothetical protein n=1 Tax=Palleronia sp. KMU-117 TaxID=3434108 RepID=UPI003D740FFC